MILTLIYLIHLMLLMLIGIYHQILKRKSNLLSENQTLYTNQSNYSSGKTISQRPKKDEAQISKSSQFKNSSKNEKPKKSVKFNSNFVTIIQVQSYKKYNINKYYNNNNSLNCSCSIF